MADVGDQEWKAITRDHPLIITPQPRSPGTAEAELAARRQNAHFRAQSIDELSVNFTKHKQIDNSSVSNPLLHQQLRHGDSNRKPTNVANSLVQYDKIDIAMPNLTSQFGQIYNHISSNKHPLC